MPKVDEWNNSSTKQHAQRADLKEAGSCVEVRENAILHKFAKSVHGLAEITALAHYPHHPSFPKHVGGGYTGGMKKSLVSLALAFALIAPSLALASTTSGTIDSTNRYAWAENVGWIDFGSSAGAVTVTDSGLSGYAYGENTGWILLSGVSNDGNGTLSGYGWGENVGFIDFSHVTIDSSGTFQGYAYGDNIGNIIMNGTNILVTTDWRPASARTVPAAPHASSGSSGGSAMSIAQFSALLAPSPATTAYLNSLKNCPAGTVCTPTAPTVPGCPSGITCTPNLPKTPNTVTFTPTAFTRTLATGAQGNDVESLQQYLNAHGFAVATTGPGSPGHETTIFGRATKAALMKFQKANGIPATGFFGPITKAFITSH